MQEASAPGPGLARAETGLGKWPITLDPGTGLTWGRREEPMSLFGVWPRHTPSGPIGQGAVEAGAVGQGAQETKREAVVTPC